MQIETALREGGCAKGAWLCKREQALSMEHGRGKGAWLCKAGTVMGMARKDTGRGGQAKGRGYANSPTITRRGVASLSGGGHAKGWAFSKGAWPCKEAWLLKWGGVSRCCHWHWVPGAWLGVGGVKGRGFGVGVWPKWVRLVAVGGAWGQGWGFGSRLWGRGGRGVCWQ